ncbi:Hsp20/alpha crystallin family protein [Metabacillus fastidiosus]|uniref:Hsp20/alpha crystallin family protein n=1 Tax=Metabacillus fastidiosus TaxID=1458 RepID=UPI002DB9881A|nr:Hsp20/alpha crystallin family protein [Metabacillus fastidiosus]MEC2075878.1 Hsp20/alpha crystallin family protein [Metabacillus fastidiosus]
MDDYKNKDNIKDESIFLEIVDRFFQLSPVRQLADEKEKLMIDSLNIPYFKVNTFYYTNEYVIEVLTPNIKKEQINFNLHDEYLTISIENKLEIEEINDQHATFKKISSLGNFSRTIILPHYVNTENAESIYEKNRLIIKFPIKNKHKNN